MATCIGQCVISTQAFEAAGVGKDFAIQSELRGFSSHPMLTKNGLRSKT